MTGTTGPLLTLDEAAAYVKLKPRTLQNKLYAGKGPKSYHLGAGRQFRVADLDAWINRHAVPAGRRRKPVLRVDKAPLTCANA
jgi:predicted DNA-binding transcriptional regulator AlpA